MSQYRSVTNTLSLTCTGSITVKDLRSIVEFADENELSPDAIVSFTETRSDGYNGSTQYRLSVSKVVPV